MTFGRDVRRELTSLPFVLLFVCARHVVQTCNDVALAERSPSSPCLQRRWQRASRTSRPLRHTLAFHPKGRLWNTLARLAITLLTLDEQANGHALLYVENILVRPAVGRTFALS